MTPEQEQKRLADWKDTLWGAWEDGMRVGSRQINHKTMKAAFYAAFDSGRASIDIIPKPRKTKARS